MKEYSDNCLYEGKQTNVMRYLGELVNAQLYNKEPMPVPENIDISEIIKLANQGQMKYIILGALVKCDIPGEIKEKIDKIIIESTLNTFIQVCTAKELEKTFEQNGISFQLLKGTVMKNIYQSPEMREMSDIDILVFPDSLKACEEILIKNGYEKETEVKHHAIFNKKPGIILEMHWDLYDKNVDKVQYEYFKDNKKSHLKENHKYEHEFSKEDFYIYMIAHMAKHFYENGCGIRNLVDIYVYKNKYKDVLDESIIADKLKKCGIYDFEKYMWILAQKWIDNKQMNSFEVNLFNYMLDCGIYGKSENGVWGQYSKANDGTQTNMVSLKKRYYFPKISYMKEFYPWLDKRPYLIGWAWILRACHGLFNGGLKRRDMLIGSDAEKRKNVQEIYNKLNLHFKR